MTKNTQKVAIITGITKGIGKAIAESLGSKGFHLVGAAREKQKIIDTCVQLQSLYKIDCLAIPTDVSQNEEVDNLVNRTIDKFGRIDILINNAGVGAFDSIVDSKLEDWHEMIDINLKGVFLCSKAVLPQMKSQKQGHIINISSVCGLRGYARCGIYCASKFGVNGLTEALFQEVKPYNIKVHVVCPDIVDTSFAGNINTTLTEKSKMLKPQDVAECVRRLIETEARSQICETRLKPLNFWQRHLMSKNIKRKAEKRIVKYL